MENLFSHPISHVSRGSFRKLFARANKRIYAESMWEKRERERESLEYLLSMTRGTEGDGEIERGAAWRGDTLSIQRSIKIRYNLPWAVTGNVSKRCIISCRLLAAFYFELEASFDCVNGRINEKLRSRKEDEEKEVEVEIEKKKLNQTYITARLTPRENFSSILKKIAIR